LGKTYTLLLARYRGQDEYINAIVSEIFPRGVSTRKAGKISKLLWGSNVNPAEANRMNKAVKRELIPWLNRAITKRIAYLIIGGAYFKVRRRRIGREAALCAVGISEQVEREHSGFFQGHRESLLTQLVRWGLDPRNVQLVTSDACARIIAAVPRTVFLSSEHQRCLFHRMANLKARCSRTEWPLIKVKRNRIYYAPNPMEARAQVKSFSKEYRGILPALVECLKKDLDARVAYMNHPCNRGKYIRTTNIIERSFKDVKRRAKVIDRFANEESCISILFTLSQAQNAL